MRKNKSLLVTLLFIILACIFTVFAHSGRTDSSGSHRDNENQSGLGSYHYHCDGHPAHLHTNGVCPYKSSGSSSSSSASSFETTYLSNSYGVTYSDSYDEGYYEGYGEGYDEGYNEGYEEGYEEGYIEGHNEGYDKGCGEGYDKGYDEGVRDIQEEATANTEKETKTFLLFIIAIIVILGLIKFFKAICNRNK